MNHRLHHRKYQSTYYTATHPTDYHIPLFLFSTFYNYTSKEVGRPPEVPLEGIIASEIEGV